MERPKKVCARTPTLDDDNIRTDASVEARERRWRRPEDLPAELIQHIGRLVPANQRGAMRLACRSWCTALSHDVTQLQLPLAALAPPPQWQVSLWQGAGAATAAQQAAPCRLFSRFPCAHHVVLIHNMVLPPASTRAALASLPSLCPNVRHVELRDSVSWEQPLELSTLVAEPPAVAPPLLAEPDLPGAGDRSAATAAAGADAASASAGVGAVGSAAAPAVGIRELTVTFLASPDMQRVTRRWFGRELERMVSPDWSIERLRVRWMMGESPRSFFTSRGFTRWINALREVAPHRLDRVEHLELAWAELSEGPFDRAPGPMLGAGTALAPPLPPWFPAPYHAALPPPPPPPAAPPVAPPAPPPFPLMPGLGPHGQAALQPIPPLPGGAAGPAAAGLGAPGNAVIAAAAAALGIVPLAGAGVAGGAAGPGGLDLQQQQLQDALNAVANIGGGGGAGGGNAANAVFAAALNGQAAEEEESYARSFADEWTRLNRTLSPAAAGLRGIGGVGGDGAVPRLGLPLAACAFTNLKSLALCCAACRAPADHLLRVLLRCRRLEKLTLVHHEAFSGALQRRTQPDLLEAMQAVVREELGLPPGGITTAPRPSAGGVTTAIGAGGSGDGATPSAPACSWWPAGLVLPLRELQLPVTPALLTLLHLPPPALAQLETLDLQMIMAPSTHVFDVFNPPEDRPMAGTARLVAALQAVRASGAQLRNLFLNNVDLCPSLLDTIAQVDSLEQLLVFSGMLVTEDRNAEPGDNDGGGGGGGGNGDDDEHMEEADPEDDDGTESSDSEGASDGDQDDGDAGVVPWGNHVMHLAAGLGGGPGGAGAAALAAGAAGAAGGGVGGLAAMLVNAPGGIDAIMAALQAQLGPAIQPWLVAALHVLQGQGLGQGQVQPLLEALGPVVDQAQAQELAQQLGQALALAQAQPLLQAQGLALGQAQAQALALGQAQPLFQAQGEALGQALGQGPAQPQGQDLAAQGLAQVQAQAQAQVEVQHQAQDPAQDQPQGQATALSQGQGDAQGMLEGEPHAAQAAGAVPTAEAPGGGVEPPLTKRGGGEAPGAADAGRIAAEAGGQAQQGVSGPGAGADGSACAGQTSVEVRGAGASAGTGAGTGADGGARAGMEAQDAEAGGRAGPRASGRAGADGGAGRKLEGTGGTAPQLGVAGAGTAEATTGDVLMRCADDDAGAGGNGVEADVPANVTAAGSGGGDADGAPVGSAAAGVPAAEAPATAAAAEAPATAAAAEAEVSPAGAATAAAILAPSHEPHGGAGPSSAAAAAGAAAVGTTHAGAHGGAGFTSAKGRAKLCGAMAMYAATLGHFLREGARQGTDPASAAAAAAAGGAAARPDGSAPGPGGGAVSASQRQAAATAAAVLDIVTGGATPEALRSGLEALRLAGGAGNRGGSSGSDSGDDTSSSESSSSNKSSSSKSSSSSVTSGESSEDDGEATSSGDAPPSAPPQSDGVVAAQPSGAAACAAAAAEAAAPPAELPQRSEATEPTAIADVQDLVALALRVYEAIGTAAPALRRQVSRLEHERDGVTGLARSLLQESATLPILECAAKVAETLDALVFAADVASRLVRRGGVGDTAAAPAAAPAGDAVLAQAAAAAAVAAAAADPEAAVEAARVARPAGLLRGAADAAAMADLHLAGLTRLSRLRKLCLDLSPDNALQLPVAGSVRYLLRHLPSLESLHVTDQYAHDADRPMGSLGLPDASGGAAGAVALYDTTYAGGAAAANKLTNLTLAARPPRRVWRPYTADASGSVLASYEDAAHFGNEALHGQLAFGGPPDRTALSGAPCAMDLAVHWRTLPRNLQALCLHHVRMLADPEPDEPPLNTDSASGPGPSGSQARKYQTAAVAGDPMAACSPHYPPNMAPAAASLHLHRSPQLPPKLQHLWLSNVTLCAPIDFAGLLRAALADAHLSGGLQTLVVRHCFVKRAPTPAATATAAAQPLHADAAGDATAAMLTSLRIVAGATSTLNELGNGGRQDGRPLIELAFDDGGAPAGADLGDIVAATASRAAAAATSVMSATGGARHPQRLVLSDAEVDLLCRMKSLRMLGLDSCVRLEDVPRLAALTALRTLALNPHVIGSEEARARLDGEIAAKSSPSLLAAIMRLGPLASLRSLWLPDWAGSRVQLLHWQSQLAATGPALVTVRVMDSDNLWRLPAPVGCPDVVDSLQWWQCEVFNTI